MMTIKLTTMTTTVMIVCVKFGVQYSLNVKTANIGVDPGFL